MILDADPGSGGRILEFTEFTESTIPLATTRSTTMRFPALVGIESARSGDSIAVENTKFSAEIRKLGF